MNRVPYTERPYQKLITSYALRTPRCAIWAGMGLGKTAAILTMLEGLIAAGDESPVLILAPKRVALTTWPEEARKWAHLQHANRVVPILGSTSERIRALNTPSPIYSINYDNLVWLIEHLGLRWPFKTVIADESTRLKSFRLRQGGKRAQALSQVAHTKIKRFVELTGTPASNGLQDLWGMVWFLDTGHRLGRSYTSFTERWFQTSYDGYGKTPLPHAQREIQEKLSDICLTIDAKDWFDLNEPIVNDIYVDLPIAARKLYKDMEDEMFMQLEEHPVEAFNAAARTIKCLQIANGAAYVNEQKDWKVVHDAKIEALEDVVEEANGASVMVAYHFKSDLTRLQKAFPRGRTLDANPKTIKEWNEGRIPILFAHPQSAGHGLNLQHGGNILVFFGHWWALEDRLQIIERIGPVRQKQSGYDRPVFIHNIIARNTVDELVLERVQTKREVQDILLAAMKRRAA